MFQNLKKRKRVLVIDGTNNLIRAISVAQKNKLSHLDVFYKILGSLISKFKPSQCYLVFDGQQGNNVKKMLYPQYKATRDGVKRIQTEDFNDLYNVIKHTPLITIRINGIQGDNVIGHIAMKNQALGNNVVIVSSDKDFYQLCSQSLQVWNPIRKTLLTQSWVKKTHNCHPINFPIYKCLIGDTSDNIKGIKGMGDKTFIRYFGDLLKEVQPINGSMQNFQKFVLQQMQHSDMKLKIMKELTLLKNLYKIISLREGAILTPQLGFKIDQIIQGKKKNLDFDRKKFILQSNKRRIDQSSQTALFTALNLITRK